jgi:hypothetical protein
MFLTFGYLASLLCICRLGSGPQTTSFPAFLKYDVHFTLADKIVLYSTAVTVQVKEFLVFVDFTKKTRNYACKLLFLS